MEQSTDTQALFGIAAALHFTVKALIMTHPNPTAFALEMDKCLTVSEN